MNLHVSLRFGENQVPRNRSFSKALSLQLEKKKFSLHVLSLLQTPIEEEQCDQCSCSEKARYWLLSVKYLFPFWYTTPVTE